MYLTVESLIDINNNSWFKIYINLRKVIVKPYWYDKMSMDKDLIEDKLYEWIDPLNERKINYRDFYFAILNNLHPCYDGNGRTDKALFVTNFS